MDLIVYLDGHSKIPKATEIKTRFTILQLRSKFGDVVFAKNPNQQDFPSKLKGAVIWEAHLGIIATVIESSGHTAGKQLVCWLKEL